MIRPADYWQRIIIVMDEPPNNFLHHAHCYYSVPMADNDGSPVSWPHWRCSPEHKAIQDAINVHLVKNT